MKTIALAIALEALEARAHAAMARIEAGSDDPRDEAEIERCASAMQALIEDAIR